MKKTVLVLGIARSGLTVTMQMLYAGGYSCAGERPAFEPFPMFGIPWDECKGKAVKVVDAQLQVPVPGNYNIIYLRRDLNEQAKSTNKFGSILSGMPEQPIKSLKNGLKKDYKAIDKWVKGHDVLRIEFEDLIINSHEVASRINDFVGGDLDVAKMADTVIPRGPGCFDGLLELQMV